MKMKIFKKDAWFVIIMMLSIVAAISVSCSQDQTETSNSPKTDNKQKETVDESNKVKEEQAIYVTPKELMTAFVNNEIAAEQKYKDKLLILSGVVTDVGKTDNSELLVTFNGEVGAVACLFPPENAKQIADVSKGKTATFQCKFRDYGDEAKWATLTCKPHEKGNIEIDNSLSENADTSNKGDILDQAQGINVTAKELNTAFEANQFAAEQKYKDKLLIVSGVVSAIFGSGEEEPVILLNNSGIGVACWFANENRTQLTNILKGNTVKFKCKYDEFSDEDSATLHLRCKP